MLRREGMATFGSRGKVERRSAPRKEVVSAARVVFERGTHFRDCTITNISSSGACLRLKENETIPEAAWLLDRETQTAYEVTVVWRLPPLVAVQFTATYAFHALPPSLAFLPHLTLGTGAGELH
jgi:PilZ domain